MGRVDRAVLMGRCASGRTRGRRCGGGGKGRVGGEGLVRPLDGGGGFRAGSQSLGCAGRGGRGGTALDVGWHEVEDAMLLGPLHHEPVLSSRGRTRPARCPGCRAVPP